MVSFFKIRNFVFILLLCVVFFMGSVFAVDSDNFTGSVVDFENIGGDFAVDAGFDILGFK